MFRWGIIFLVIALIAAALGFGSPGGYGSLGGKNCLCRRYYSVPGQPVYRAPAPVDAKARVALSVLMK
ncbi:Small integral membrane protein [Raoultella terrigena]|uniref:Small integral membrane protein n=1 Tax=Raoultella terrigena TaxID=577 RepID=A0A4U9D7B3_RAOTE|nr:Small integral membrane protein [Raoultella terrigena]